MVLALVAILFGGAEPFGQFWGLTRNIWVKLFYIWARGSEGDVVLRVFYFSSGPEVIKLFSCETQLSTKFITLINVKMPTIVGILTLISRINTATKSLTARKIIIFQHFNFN